MCSIKKMEARLIKSITAIKAAAAALTLSMADEEEIREILSVMEANADVICGIFAEAELDKVAKAPKTAAITRKFQPKVIFKRYLGATESDDPIIRDHSKVFTEHFKRVVKSAYPEVLRNAVVECMIIHAGETHEDAVDTLFETVFNSAKIKKAHGDLHDIFFRDAPVAKFLDSIGAVKNYSFVAASA